MEFIFPSASYDVRAGGFLKAGLRAFLFPRFCRYISEIAICIIRSLLNFSGLGLCLDGVEINGIFNGWGLAISPAGFAGMCPAAST